MICWDWRRSDVRGRRPSGAGPTQGEGIALLPQLTRQAWRERVYGVLMAGDSAIFEPELPA